MLLTFFLSWDLLAFSDVDGFAYDEPCSEALVIIAADLDVWTCLSFALGRLEVCYFCGFGV